MTSHNNYIKPVAIEKVSIKCFFKCDEANDFIRYKAATAETSFV